MNKPYPGYKPYRAKLGFETITGPLYYLREVGYYLFSAFIVTMMLAISITCLIFIPFVDRGSK